MGRAAWLLTLFFLAPTLARADDRVAPNPSAPATATSEGETEYNGLVKRAVAEYELAHFTEAKAFFARAHQLRPSARTLRGLGLASYELRSYVEALVYLRQSLASQERPLTEEMRAEVKSTLEEAKSFIAREKLSLEPHDVRVRVDGQPGVFDDDGSLLLDPGPHDVQLESSGFEPLTHPVNVKGGERAELQLTLRALSAPASEDKSRPASSAEDRSSDESSFWSSRTTQHKIGLGLGAGGVAALGVGTVFGILALSANSSSKEACTGDACSAKGYEERKSALSRADAATVAFIASGALLGAGAIVYFTSPAKRQPESAFNLIPALAPGVAAIDARGHF